MQLLSSEAKGYFNGQFTCACRKVEFITIFNWVKCTKNVWLNFSHARESWVDKAVNHWKLSLFPGCFFTTAVAVVCASTFWVEKRNGRTLKRSHEFVVINMIWSLKMLQDMELRELKKFTEGLKGTYIGKIQVMFRKYVQWLYAPINGLPPGWRVRATQGKFDIFRFPYVNFPTLGSPL